MKQCRGLREEWLSGLRVRGGPRLGCGVQSLWNLKLFFFFFEFLSGLHHLFTRITLGKFLWVLGTFLWVFVLVGFSVTFVCEIQRCETIQREWINVPRSWVWTIQQRCFVSNDVITIGGKTGLRAVVPGFKSQPCHLEVVFRQVS